MFPKNTSRTFITVSLGKGPVPEPDISNQDFLNSYLEYSCWLRMLSARNQLTTIENPNVGKLEKLAAIANFYQLAGIMVEDALSTYIAWAVWSTDKSQLIPNLLERISLKLSKPTKILPLSYASDTNQKFASTNKRVEIFAREYLSQVLNSPDEDLPKLFGIDWKKNPSIKVVQKEMLPMWLKLGTHLRDCISPLIDPKGPHLTSCYNKMKHGPQITIMAPMIAAKSRGFPVDDIENQSSSVEAIRLLLNGARLQESDEEFHENTRTSPFLIMDAANIRRWFFQQILHNTNVLYGHGTWIYNSNFRDHKRKMTVESPEIQKIIREQGRHLKNTFP